MRVSRNEVHHRRDIQRDDIIGFSTRVEVRNTVALGKRLSFIVFAKHTLSHSLCFRLTGY